MPSVTAGVVLDGARSLLNDSAGNLWSDAALIPKLQIAHRELQTLLKTAAAPVLRKTSAAITVNAGNLVVNLPIDLQEPIRLWENTVGQPYSSATLMTECDILPQDVQSGTLKWWNWSLEAINLVGATVGRDVFIHYWRQIPVPAASADSVSIIWGEMYLIPRLAAIAAGSTGMEKVLEYCSGLADKSINDVIIANKGRSRPIQEGTPRP